MDLSLKKPRREVPVPPDMPQDLSMKKRKHNPEHFPGERRYFHTSQVKGIHQFDFYAYLEATSGKETSTTKLHVGDFWRKSDPRDAIPYTDGSEEVSQSPCRLEAVTRSRRRKQANPRKIIKEDVEMVNTDDDWDSETSLTDLIYMADATHDSIKNASVCGIKSNGDARLFKRETVAETMLRSADSPAENTDRPSILPTVLGDCEDESNDGATSCLFQSDSGSNRKKLAHALKLKSPRKGRPCGATSVMLLNREHRRRLRLFGKEYTTPSGKTYPERKVREKDCSKCRYNCSQNISKEQQQAIFDHFWGLNSYVKRLYYYCQSIKEKPAKTMTHTRECSREYTFLVGSERIRVCKGFYLATLDVSDKAVRIAMEKRKKGVSLCDKRGNHPPHNKTKPEDKDRIRRHIEDFLLGHICRKDSSEETFMNAAGSDMNITRMHQQYAMQCKMEGRESVSEDVYRKTFNSEYNLSCAKVL